MAHHLRQMAAVVFLLSSLGAALVWVASFRHEIGMYYPQNADDSGQHWEFECGYGSVELGTAIIEGGGDDPGPTRYPVAHSHADLNVWLVEAHQRSDSDPTYRSANYSLTIRWPLTLLVITASCAIAFRYARHVIRRGWSPPVRGLCRSCRYNLHGNVSGVCPECGTPVPIPVT